MELTFPYQLERIKKAILAQEATLKSVAADCANALEHGGLVHVYANGHSRIAVEELVVRMGALTGFHPLLPPGLVTFDGVVGNRGIRVNQSVERYEGIGDVLLAEFDIGPHDALIAISATGTTPAAVDTALAFSRRYPEHPLIVIASLIQARDAKPKHSSNKTLYHVAHEAKRAYFLDNGMPLGDLSVTVEGKEQNYQLCPLSSIGALTIVQSLNELIIRELDQRGVQHPVLQNMHLQDTGDSYEAWVRDQRGRYARALYSPQRDK